MVLVSIGASAVALIPLSVPFLYSDLLSVSISASASASKSASISILALAARALSAPSKAVQEVGAKLKYHHDYRYKMRTQVPYELEGFSV